MASHGHDALWAKLWELELQLAAYKLLHAARCGEEEDDGAGATEAAAGTGACCRGRQYDAYMRRRDARRAAEVQRQRPSGGTRGRPSPLTVKCAARDTPQVRRSLPAVPTTPRKDRGALPLARSRTVSGAPAAAKSQSHQRRNSVGGDLGDCATPRPFLRRGSGTGGATGVHLRSPRVYDLPSSSPSPRRPRPQPQDHLVTKVRHLRSVSELPFHATAAAMESPSPSPRWVETPGPAQAWARKRWGSAESPPPVLFSAAAANPHMDLAKGLKKLLSFVRKSKSGERQQHGGSGRDSGDGKPVKEWARATACSGLDDGPFDRARLEGHRFPMTRAVGTSR